MNSPVNPFGALPVYEQLEQQMAFRHGGPTLICPADRVPSWQIRVPFYDATPRLTIVSANGMRAINISARALKIEDPEDSETFFYTFIGGVMDTPLPCGLFYMYININGKVYLTERFETRAIPNGGRVDVTLEATTDLTFTAVETNTTEASSYHWEYFDGQGWDTIVADGTLSSFTVDPSLFWQSSPQDMFVKVRRRLVYSGYSVESYYNLMLRETVANSELLPVAHPNELTQENDYYLLEYWNDSDDFGYKYTTGFRQRMYVMATYDGMGGDETDNFDNKPTGESDLRSSIFKPRPRLSMAGLPDFAYPALEAMCRHDNVRILNLRTGVENMAVECQFEPGQGQDPLSMTGTLSFVNNIFYRSGARQNIPVTTNDPTRLDQGGLDGD